MRDEEVKLVVGALLHDIGKVVYRQGADKRNHSQSGYDYLLDTIKLEDKEILNCVRYHHADAMKGANIPQDSFAYIVYIADNIASAVDRREKMQEEVGFEIHTTMQPVFNILNGNKKNFYYNASVLNPDGEINYPTEQKGIFDESQYNMILQGITDNLKGLDWNIEYINSLLEVLEANLSFVPSSTARNEVADISLYDHLKLTAAIASCIYAFLNEKGIVDYKSYLYDNAKEFYGEKAFLLASLDVSGIQNFIYTITTKNALKTLRSRSFYLEIMMEHMIDMLLQKLHLSRANLLYVGGGHCYLLIPNTLQAKDIFEEFIQNINKWYRENFDISLYIAGGCADCSCNDLHNVPQGSYGQIFLRVGREISKRKSNRYSAKELIELNHREVKAYDRECCVCKKIDQVNENGVCRVCDKIEKFSKKVLYARFFAITLKEEEDSLLLPGGYHLIADSEESLRERMKIDDYFVRAYGKNQLYTGKHIATKLWVGDYTNGQSFEEFAQIAEGIDRIAVLRADVDNLGQAIVAGFNDEENKNRYVTLSRTATLSRQLSLFFKLYINQILNNPKYSFTGNKKNRNATIVYSGGDDVFIVGAWNDVIELAIDIKNALKRYTEGALTISAGVGIYHNKYPISVMAEEVADLEEKSKQKNGKNSITLFEDGEYHIEKSEGQEILISDGTYSWEEFEREVLEEKFAIIKSFFDKCDDKGKSFLYKMLELVREQSEKINFARFVYLLARLEPDNECDEEKKEMYREFSKKMYQWMSETNKEIKAKHCRQLKTAIVMYVYLERKEEE